MKSELLSCSSQVQSLQVRCFYWFHILFLSGLESQSIKPRLRQLPPMTAQVPQGRNCSTPTLTCGSYFPIKTTGWHTRRHTQACGCPLVPSYAAANYPYAIFFFWSTLYNHWLSHTHTHAHTLARSRLPLASSSCMHMSTTMGLLVLWALTSVVRSQLYTFLTCRRSGWQSFGTTLEHCLWTFNPQSDRERNSRQTVWNEIVLHHCMFTLDLKMSCP